MLGWFHFKSSFLGKFRSVIKGETSALVGVRGVTIEIINNIRAGIVIFFR